MSADAIPVSQLYLHNYLHLLGIVIFFYDYAITFDDEYWRVWRTPTTGASLVFLLNRYFAFFTNIAITAGNFATFKTTQSCARYAFYRQLCLIIIQVIVAVNQFLRIYALYSRSRRIAALIFSIGGILLALSIWAVIGQKSDISLSEGCHLASSRLSAIRIAVAWESLFIYDFLIFSLTFLKTYRQRSMYSGPGRNDLIALIVRDGAIYFAVMACAQCANTMTFYLCPPALRGVLSTFASNVSVTMMCRFMLNLHRTATERLHNYSTASTDFGSVASSGMVFTSRVATTAGLRTTRGAAAADTLPPPLLPPPWTEEFELASVPAGQIEEVHRV